MTFMQKLLGAAAGAALLAGAAQAEPGLIIDLGGKFDKSFNESAYTGAQRWKEETGNDYMETELQSEAQREQTMRRMAERGANPVVVLGFANASTLEKVAPDYPDTNFVIVDMVVDQPNVQSVVFSEHEGSYLVGVMAAKASETGTVSFVGGMDVPLIRKFACGYAQGAKDTNPDINVVANMTGTTPTAWNDPVKGGELTRAQISQGSDVVYAAAGGTGVGVLQTAADEGILAIGVDSNQNYLHPGSILTSMTKQVDKAVYDAFQSAAEGNFQTGLQVKDLASEGVGYAMDEHNADLVTEEMQQAVDEAAEKIKSGEIAVHDYTSDDSCPALSF
ncbi:putative sugar ABC transporter, periplasmic sugar-binding protein [Oceaniovalibus guishaninsula JLT2003]|uniref:Putative sugar ABC transporter, periplasmic sugar-binding protein n=1 Tax=Oceaniovalibus guishaninsula JLT2003 TaxID=1231392 RepID=K2GSP6_9RHOB|nr:BMP family ABC transporter substrate-binding protein [Oceaniovalibus guishaninsula]EKE45571.1 putative sugar ABC transporter, periplasmic sugar-binding protein [Oceaniovalibus guishaninsula JLT2003]